MLVGLDSATFLEIIIILFTDSKLKVMSNIHFLK